VKAAVSGKPKFIATRHEYGNPEETNDPLKCRRAVKGEGSVETIRGTPEMAVR